MSFPGFTDYKKGDNFSAQQVVSDQSLAALELSMCVGVGPVVGQQLIQHFKGATEVFGATAKALSEVIGRNSRAHFEISQCRKFEQSHDLVKLHGKLGIGMVSVMDNDYPYRLRELANAPLVLFFRGEIDWNAKRILGVVGTRRPTAFGRGAAAHIVQNLQHSGVIIVSGMAYGIDGIAHETALSVQLNTWGVMAHGLERVYPSAHSHLSNQMCAGRGGLISEFPANTNMHPDLFPRRNRIVAGLCDALLVVESGLKGGSMITCSIAHGYNRDVFAVPGRPIDPNAEGCNFLIKKNMAALCTDASDILDFMNWQPISNQSNQPPDSCCSHTSLSNSSQHGNISLNPTEQQILQWLTAGITHPDAMVAQNSWGTSALSMALLDLEMKGLIQTLPGNRYQTTLSGMPNANTTRINP